MDKHILPCIPGAMVTVLMKIDSISEGFDLAELVKMPAQVEPKGFERVLGARQRDISDEALLKRCFHCVGNVSAHPAWENAEALKSWPKDQPILVSVSKTWRQWEDEDFAPILGYVEGLEKDYLSSGSSVLINLQLPSHVADKLFDAVNASIDRPNTDLTLSIELKFTQSFKSHDGQGSGAPLWYPRAVNYYRVTKKTS